MIENVPGRRKQFGIGQASTRTTKGRLSAAPAVYFSPVKFSRLLKTLVRRHPFSQQAWLVTLVVLVPPYKQGYAQYAYSFYLFSRV